MKITIEKSDDRGTADYGWLTARYSFSFGEYRNPSRMGFGALRVFNDDHVAPGYGFDTHAHDNFEIITIPLTGSIVHKDSMGNEGVITPLEVQTMSAGSGVEHSEKNAHEEQDLTHLQIWITTKTVDIEPQYQQKLFPVAERDNRWQLLVSGDESGEGCFINQDAQIHRALIDKNGVLTYEVKPGRGIFVFVISGGIILNDNELFDRDSAQVTDTDAVIVSAEEEHTDVLLVDVPLDS